MKLTIERLIILLRSQNKKLNAGYALIFVVGIIAAFILLGDRTNIYSVKGNTQAITIDTTGALINQWRFSEGVLVSEEFFMEPIDLSLNRSFEFAPGTKLRITSINNVTKHQLLITGRSDDVMGELIANNTAQPLSGYVEIMLTLSRNFVLPFEGTAFVGEDVGQNVESLLLAGEVNILESRFLSSGRYPGESYTLDTGDRISIVDNDAEYVSKGFLRITQSDAFYFSVVSEGDGVQVTRFGNEDLLITPSVWSRVTKDPVVAAITSLFALMFLLLEFALLLKQTLLNKE